MLLFNLVLVWGIILVYHYPKNIEIIVQTNMIQLAGARAPQHGSYMKKVHIYTLKGEPKSLKRERPYNLQLS